MSLSLLPFFSELSGNISQIHWTAMLFALFGGLALFLLGMDYLSNALQQLAGSQLKEYLARLTGNRVSAAITGAGVTAAIQSSSVTTVLVVGFVNAGLMNLAQAAGIIFGANIGTTITAQLVAFNVKEIALPLISIGFLFMTVAKAEKTQQYGKIALGMGLLFFGMSMMGDGMRPLRSNEWFLNLLATMQQPLFAILVSAIFTAIIQASAATTGIVIVFASQGLITLPTGIALILGANIGTCITALLASIGRPRIAVQAALIHVVFNVVGVLIWLPILNQLAWLSAALSPSYPELSGSALLAKEVPRQIANAHTLFNVANTLFLLPFTTQIIRFVEWIFPRQDGKEQRLQTRHLDTLLLTSPTLALQAARKETERLGRRVIRMLSTVSPNLLENRVDLWQRLDRLDDEVDYLHTEVIRYLGKIGQQDLSENETKELLALLEAVNALENIGDLIETNICNIGRSKARLHIRFSSASQKIINDLLSDVHTQLMMAIEAVVSNDPVFAQAVIDRKEELNQQVAQAYKHQASRVSINPDRVDAYSLEIDLIERVKYIYYYSKRIAKTVIRNHSAGITDHTD